MNSRISAGPIWLIFTSVFLIVSCTSNSHKHEATTYAVQPGEKLNTYLLANNAQPNNINALLLKYDGSKKAKRHIKLYRNEIAELFTKKVLDITPSTNSDEIKSRL